MAGGAGGGGITSILPVKNEVRIQGNSDTLGSISPYGEVVSPTKAQVSRKMKSAIDVKLTIVGPKATHANPAQQQAQQHNHDQQRLQAESKSAFSFGLVTHSPIPISSAVFGGGRSWPVQVMFMGCWGYLGSWLFQKGIVFNGGYCYSISPVHQGANIAVREGLPKLLHPFLRDLRAGEV